MTATRLASAGFYGKLPSRGDFVLRQLPSDFVGAWDAWLSASIVASETRIGAAWRERFLMAPPWRFAVAPGLAGATGWIGVMLTSADAVGRAFPLTLAAALPPGSGLGRLVGDAGAGLARLERLGLGLISGGRDPETVGAEIAEAGAAAVKEAGAGIQRSAVDGGWAVVGRPQDAVAVRLTMVTREASFERRSLWWHDGWGGGPAGSFAFTGLPAPGVFHAFLAGEKAAADRTATG